MLPTFNYYELSETTICPYCGSEQSCDSWRGCCGESSAHFTKAYKTDGGDIYTEDEINIVKPWRDWLYYEVYLTLTHPYLRREQMRVLKVRTKRLFTLAFWRETLRYRYNCLHYRWYKFRNRG